MRTHAEPEAQGWSETVPAEGGRDRDKISERKAANRALSDYVASVWGCRQARAGPEPR